MNSIKLFFLIMLCLAIVVIALITFIVRSSTPKTDTSSAKVIDKRNESKISVSTNHGSTFVSYYLTFELVSGDRKVFSVRKEAYGTILIGDEGLLSFKGNKFLDFVRK